MVGDELTGLMFIPAGRSMLHMWRHSGSSCPADSPMQHGPLPCACQWHCSPAGDHPFHGLHPSAVTPCSEQPHAAKAPLQGCAFSWWQWGKTWVMPSLQWLCFRDISSINLLHWGWGIVFPMRGAGMRFQSLCKYDSFKACSLDEGLRHHF